ncbi:MAG TPA: MMPL family transporter [Kofleriaceae bacterium]|nr:MMPL family transporter [Kofleriaceae bacterium]
MKRRSIAILLAWAAVLAASVYLVAWHLPLFADFSYLLPQDAPAVRDLRRLEARVKAPDTVLVVIDAPDPAARAAAMREMTAAIRALPKDLVDDAEDDDADIRAFLRAHRELYVPLPELERAERAIADEIKQAKLRANPLYVDLDDDADAASKTAHDLDELRAKRRDAEARLQRSSHVSADGKIGMIEIRIAFSSTDVDRGEKLVHELAIARDRGIAAHPGVRMGFTGGNITSLAEHDAIARGMLWSSLVTTLLVGLVLVLYFRSATLLSLLTGTLAIATTVAFGVAALTVGHLNAATAFLGAIIAGNGVNYGILMIARYLEERRTHEVEAALATAIVGTLRPTAVASLGASIAYGSLAATSFKGFADFAVIGAIGMLLCWIATFTLLPALIVRWGRDTRNFVGEPFVGRALVKVLGFRKPQVVCACAAVLAIVAGVIVVRYVAADPFEYDIKHLRSEGHAAVEAREWMRESDAAFGRGYAGRTYIAADRADQVPQIVTALRDRDPDERVIGSIASILDVVPAEQAKKLEVLAKIRAQLDDPALADLDDKARAELAELRPPDHLEAVTVDALPPRIRDSLVEKDGRVGLIVSISTASSFNEWNGHELMRFARAVRRLDLRDGETVTTSGASVIFADIIESIELDGPLVTGIAAGGLVVMVWLLVGRNRRAVAVLAATAAGSLLMVAACATAGIKVSFLDFVALPITLGLGIDYAINVAHRHDHEAVPDPITTLRTSGSAVFVCSLTTMIGYGSLLVSDNLAIRGFGSASLIGEITCVLTALVLVPALLALGRCRRRT